MTEREHATAGGARDRLHRAALGRLYRWVCEGLKSNAKPRLKLEAPKLG